MDSKGGVLGLKQIIDAHRIYLHRSVTGHTSDNVSLTDKLTDRKIFAMLRNFILCSQVTLYFVVSGLLAFARS